MLSASLVDSFPKCSRESDGGSGRGPLAVPPAVQEDHVKEELETIRTGIRLLFKSGHLVEVRVRLASGYWRGFYFTDHERMAHVVKKLDDDSRVVSVYYVINPCKPNLLKEREKCQYKTCSQGGLLVANPTDKQIERILEGPTQHLTSNEDVDTLQWLFIDIDTVRAPGFAAKALQRGGIVSYAVGQKFEGDKPAEASVLCLIDHAHATRTQRGLDFVGTKFRARGEVHPWA